MRLIKFYVFPVLKLYKINPKPTIMKSWNKHNKLIPFLYLGGFFVCFTISLLLVSFLSWILHKQPKDIFSALLCSATSLTSVQMYIHLYETEQDKVKFQYIIYSDNSFCVEEPHIQFIFDSLEKPAKYLGTNPINLIHSHDMYWKKIGKCFIL